MGRAVDFSAIVSNDQWAERIALNAVLSGVDESAFRREQATVLDDNVWGPWAHDGVLQRELLQLRIAKHRWAQGDLAAAVAKYEVGYIALPRGTTPDPHIAQTWDDVGSTDWSIWRNPNVRR